VHYLLVHGSWHGSWCWEKLIPHLERRSHTASAIDLPSDPASSYGDYVRCVEGAIERLPAPMVVVSHSMSGVVVAPLADRVAHSFYIAAFLPPNGESLLDAAIRFNDSDVPSILRVDEQANLDYIDPVGARDVFYGDLDDETAQWAIERLRPQPRAPILEPMQWLDRDRHRSRRTYIVCTQDRDVSVAGQWEMAEASAGEIRPIECGHFPFLSHPEKLADLLEVRLEDQDS